MFDERVPRWGPVDLTELLSRALDDVRHRATEADVGVVSDIAPNPTPLTGDARAGRRIIENSLDDAVRFTSPGGSVRLSSIPSTGDVVITVTDSGAGIPQDVLARIGRRFPEGEVGIVGGANRTSTALALSLRLARSIGADLRIGSRPGEGTSAPLRLLRQADFRREQPTQTADAAAAS